MKAYFFFHFCLSFTFSTVYPLVLENHSLTTANICSMLWIKVDINIASYIAAQELTKARGDVSLGLLSKGGMQ